jgi:hypothetical protein
MPVFEEIRVSWKGREHVIPPDQVLHTIARVEGTLTLAELGRYQLAASMPLAKLSQAMGIVLRAAGARASDDEVYTSLFGQGEIQTRALRVISTLQMMMIPPEHLTRGMPAGKPSAPRGDQTRAAPTGRRWWGGVQGVWGRPTTASEGRAGPAATSSGACTRRKSGG